MPPIWGCFGPTRGSFFTHRQIKNPASSEIAVKTHSRFGPHLADHFACVTPALKKGWMFYLPMGKKWTPSRSTTIPDRWYQKFFFFWPTGTSNNVWKRPLACLISIGLVRIFYWEFSDFFVTHNLNKYFVMSLENKNTSQVAIEFTIINFFAIIMCVH